jgi:hypothetical protein
MSVAYLVSEDFSIQQSAKGNVLCHNIPNFSLVLYYSNFCKECEPILNVFKKLPNLVIGCQFGIVNVSTNKKCIELASKTITPIRYVPYIIMYINGKPYMSYNGDRDVNSIKQFVIEFVSNVQRKQEFSKEKTVQEKDDGIPKYCLGKPISGGRDQQVCYLNFLSAYESKKN